MKKIVILIICIIVPLVIGALGGVATTSGLESWYQTIQKPSFNPPNYLFGPVWSLLYILMGISFYLILISKNQKPKTKAIAIFVIQIILNLAWSFIFFKFHLLGWALIEIILIWIAVLAMITIFYRINKVAAFLQIPYLVWVSFASILNGAFWYIN